jgi:hypothetical protein
VSRRLLILPSLVGAWLALSATAASASDNNGHYGTTKTAHASTGRGTVTVGVGIRRPQRGSTAHGSDTTAPQPPALDLQGPGAGDQVVCTFEGVNLITFQKILGVGGPEPGYWALENCFGPNGKRIPEPPVWIVVAKPGNPAPAGVPVAPPPVPGVVALQAERQLQLPSATIEMAPPARAFELVNLSTWLWLNPAIWKPYSATASIDGVAATATATPEKVLWNMGNGAIVTCDGPGTPYSAADPNATTDCSYTWSAPSSIEASGTYDVSATTEWQVSWSAVGAAGGGSLGILAGPAAHVAVRVSESQAINTPTGQSS